MSGPFGTYEAHTLAERAAFWLFIMGAGLAAGITLRVAIQSLRPGTPYLTASFSAAILLAVVLGPVLPWIGDDVFGLHVPFLPSALEVAFVIVVIGCGLALLRHYLTEETTDRPVGAEVREDGRPSPAPRLEERLPQNLAGRILHLSVDDHYVDVTTDKGNARLLLRFSDAIAEVAPVEGIRVHRSHWVACDAIERIERDGGRHFVILENGTRVPVSRGYRTALEGLRNL